VIQLPQSEGWVVVGDPVTTNRGGGLSLVVQLPESEGVGWDPLIGLTSLHFFACPNPGFTTTYVQVFVVLFEVRDGCSLC
jgi:hypothetical protein